MSGRARIAHEAQSCKRKSKGKSKYEQVGVSIYKYVGRCKKVYKRSKKLIFAQSSCCL